MLLDKEIVKQEKELHNAVFWAMWRCGPCVCICEFRRENPTPISEQKVVPDFVVSSESL